MGKAPTMGQAIQANEESSVLGKSISAFASYIGGIFQTISQTAVVHGTVYKMIGSAAVSTVPFIHKHFANKNIIQDWTHARVISERIKVK